MLRPTVFIFPALLTLLPGCAGDARSGRTEYLGARTAVVNREGGPAWDDTSHWDGDGISDAPSIRIDLGAQRAFFYKGGELAGVSVISSGREGFGTPGGQFKVIQKDRDHRSNLYGDYVDAGGNVVKKDVDVKKDPRPPGATFRGAPMPYFLRIHGGVGMHAGFLPGYPASHGCIRLPKHLARSFFENIEVGAPVEVVN